MEVCLGRPEIVSCVGFEGNDQAIVVHVPIDDDVVFKVTVGRYSDAPALANGIAEKAPVLA
jgi:hypothetical protein